MKLAPLTPSFGSQPFGSSPFTSNPFGTGGFGEGSSAAPSVTTYALSFDGSNDKVQVPAGADVNLATKYSISARVKALSSGTSGVGRIVDKDTVGIRFFIANGSGSDFRVRCAIDHDTTDADAYGEVAGQLTPNTDHHVVMTYNEDNDKKIKLYAAGS
jgi:hypothetical protein